MQRRISEIVKGAGCNPNLHLFRSSWMIVVEDHQNGKENNTWSIQFELFKQREFANPQKPLDPPLQVLVLIVKPNSRHAIFLPSESQNWVMSVFIWCNGVFILRLFLYSTYELETFYSPTPTNICKI